MKTVERMIRFVCLVLIPLAVGCGGDQFTETETPDAGKEAAAGTGGSGGNGGNGGNAGSSGTAGSSGVGGEAGDAGLDAGPDTTGGSAGDGGTAGQGGMAGTGGDAGPDADADMPDADAAVEADAPDPCTKPVTADEAAMMLGKPCTNFPAFECNTNNPVPRGEFVKAVVSLVPEKLQGYEEAGEPSFSDIAIGSYFYGPLDKAVWLELVSPGGAFHPDNPTLKCWAQELVAKMQALPSIYAMVSFNQSTSTLASTSGPTTVVSLRVYGTSPSNHLTHMVRVVNNLGGNFSVPQPTNALEAVVLLCQVPEGGSIYTTYSAPLDGSGKAEIGTLDCHNAAGGAMDLQLQMDPAPAPGSVGQQARLGIDTDTLPVRGGQAGSPTKTIN